MEARKDNKDIGKRRQFLGLQPKITRGKLWEKRRVMRVCFK